MSISIWFWVLSLLVLIGYSWAYWPQDPARRPVFGGWFALFVLIMFLGLAVFGSPLKG